MKIILLIIIGISILNADFTRTGNTVIDSTTKLEWQDDDVVLPIKWKDAIKKCESLVLSGYSDWRLPNIKELNTIVDRSRYKPAIVGAFQNTAFANAYETYWSSTSYDNTIWNIDFLYGRVTLESIEYSEPTSYVRCVRGGQ